MASAGPYASLHLTPDRQPRQHPTTQTLAITQSAMWLLLLGLVLSVCLLPIAIWYLSSDISQFSYSNDDSAGFAAKFRIIFIK